MTQEEILKEIKKCKDSPYYFATKYLIVKNHNNQSIPFITALTEEQFNKIFKDYENRRNIRVQ